MALCNPFPYTWFKSKQLKYPFKIMWRNYLAIKNYIVKYKLQNGAHSRE